MKQRILPIANTCAFLITVFISCAASTGLLGEATIGAVSARYQTLVTPADYAFSIWVPIYLMLAAFVFYQVLGLVKHTRNGRFVRQIGWWFVVSCLANSGWAIAWVYDYTSLSVLLMALLLGSLMKIVVNTNMERWDAPFPIIFFLWWPFCLYSGWVTLALIANVAAWLTKLGWIGGGLNPVGWALLMIAVAGLINFLMIWTRNMREFALVGAWGLIAIAAANRGTFPVLVWAASITAAFLLVNIAIHGWRNRATSPLVKWRQMRQSAEP